MSYLSILSAFKEIQMVFDTLKTFSKCVPKITYIKIKIQGPGLGICILSNTMPLSPPGNLDAH